MYIIVLIIVTIVVAWLMFSALLVTIICMNSARISKLENKRELAMVIGWILREEERQRSEKHGS